MDAPPKLSLSPPTPTFPATPASPATPTAAGNSRLQPATSTSNPKKKRTKVFSLQLQPPSPAKPKPPPRKPDPFAPKITMPCSECGKKFWSWKALYGHMRCHPDRQWRGVNPPPNVRRISDNEAFPSPEDHEAAASLLLLANSLSPREIILVAGDDERAAEFECSSCSKRFNSHQALGGHRASHQSIKGCFAAGEEVEGVAELGHRCDVCMRVFSTGQALGGHKRCHWEKSLPPSTAAEGGGSGGLDLNLPACSEEKGGGGGGLELVLRLGL